MHRERKRKGTGAKAGANPRKDLANDVTYE
jgi:hypothetical protein